MARPSLSSLRVRLILLVLIAVAPALGLALYSASEQRRQAVEKAQVEAMRLARRAASNHQRLAEGARQLLVGMAHVAEEHRREPGECSKEFSNFLKQFPFYTNLGAVAPDGDVFCSAVPLSRPINVSDRSYFQRAVETRAFAAGDYQVGRVTGKASVNFGYPILDNAGALIAVVFVGLDLGWLNRLAQDPQLAKGTVLLAVDQNATVLARYPDAAEWMGRASPEAAALNELPHRSEGTGEMAGADGTQRLLAFASLA